MSEQIEFSRLIAKRSAIEGVTPTIPSVETIDETWISTDLKDGEFFINTFDQRVWYRSKNSIIEISTSGNGTSVSTTNGTVTTALTIPIDTDSCKLLDVEYVAIQTDGTKGMTTNLRGTYRNDGGTVSLIGAVGSVKVSDFAAALGQLTISGTDVLIEIQGEAATNISWSVKVKTSQVKV